MDATKLIRRMLGTGTILTMLSFNLPLEAHKAAERYIPIGQSPGVSHKFTVVGKIEAVNTGLRSVTVASPSGNLTIEIPNDARIWIDRSKLKRTNLNGGFTDFMAGRTIEVEFVDPNRKRVVDWIKVDTGRRP